MAGIKEILFTFIRDDGSAAIFPCLLLEYAGLPIPGETLIAGSNRAVIGRVVGIYTLAAFALILYAFLVFKFCRRFKIPVLLLSASLMSFILFTSELLEKELSPFDAFLYGNLSRLITEDRTDLMKLITDMGSPYVFGAVTVALLAVLRRRQKSLFYGKMMIADLAEASLLNFLFKSVFHRARPDILPLVQASGYSYPSGHSMISAAFYGYLIYLCAVHLKRPWKQIASVSLVFLILAIGISRVYLGVHYASDVIGGFLAGFSWLIVLVAWTELYQGRQKSKVRLTTE